MSISRRQSWYQALLSASSNTYSWPSTTLNGSLLVVIVIADGSIMSMPSGYTEVSTGLSNPNIFFYYKANASPESNVATYFMGSCASMMISVEYTGVKTDSPLDQTGNTASTSFNSPVITSSEDNELIISAYGYPAENIFDLSIGSATQYDILYQDSLTPLAGCYVDNMLSGPINTAGSQNIVMSGNTSGLNVSKTIASFKGAASIPSINIQSKKMTRSYRGNTSK